MDFDGHGIYLYLYLFIIPVWFCYAYKYYMVIMGGYLAKVKKVILNFDLDVGLVSYTDYHCQSYTSHHVATRGESLLHINLWMLSDYPF